MILVTGGTGLIGGEVLRRLSQAGVPVRALTRDLTKSREPPGVTWVAGDLAKPETLRAAFEGAGTLFLLTHYYEDMVELQHNAIAAARAAGVSHVVKVSAFAASGHSRAPIGRWHFQVEMTLQDSGMAWTMLRPYHFMQNLLAQAPYVIHEGVTYSASGDGRIPYVDARDVAAVAVAVLTTPGHFGKKYVVTGSEALSYRQAAGIIGAVIGKPVQFVDESPEQAKVGALDAGVTLDDLLGVRGGEAVRQPKPEVIVQVGERLGAVRLALRAQAVQHPLVGRMRAGPRPAGERAL